MSQHSETITIRAASMADMAEIARIYAHYVSHTTITFEITPPSVDVIAQRYGDIWAAGAPYLVAIEDANVVGFAYAAPYKARAAYRYTLEHSIYLDPKAAGKGIGRMLLESLIESCRAAGFCEMLATVAGDENVASLRLHARCGFVPVGVLKNVGFKQNRWLDVTLLQLSLRGKP